MARLAQAAVLLTGAVCVLALVASAHEAPPPKFTVQGQVVCEVCRCNFINKLSEPMAGIIAITLPSPSSTRFELVMISIKRLVICFKLVSSLSCMKQ